MNSQREKFKLCQNMPCILYIFWVVRHRNKWKKNVRGEKNCSFLFACSCNTRHNKDVVPDHLKWSSLTSTETNLIYYCKLKVQHFILHIGFAWLWLWLGGVLQGWLVWKATRSFHHIQQSQSLLAQKIDVALAETETIRNGSKTSVITDLGWKKNRKIVAQF